MPTHTVFAHPGAFDPARAIQVSDLFRVDVTCPATGRSDFDRRRLDVPGHDVWGNSQ
jgi:hypothetical protein